MTFEVYLNGALWFRKLNWIPTGSGEEYSDGRQLNGEWCEIHCKSVGYESNGAKWRSSYEIKADIPTYARLSRSVVSTDYIENPGGIVDEPYSFRYQAAGSGPRTGEQIRIAGLNRNDDNKFNGQDSFRLVVKIYFVRVSLKIIRDPASGKIIRSAGGLIIHDA